MDRGGIIYWPARGGVTRLSDMKLLDAGSAGLWLAFALVLLGAIGIEQLTLKPPTENSKGIRLGSFVLIRGVIEEELEQAFSGKQSPQAALDLAVERGNRLLRQFERANPDR